MVVTTSARWASRFYLKSCENGDLASQTAPASSVASVVNVISFWWDEKKRKALFFFSKLKISFFESGGPSRVTVRSDAGFILSNIPCLNVVNSVMIVIYFIALREYIVWGSRKFLVVTR